MAVNLFLFSVVLQAVSAWFAFRLAWKTKQKAWILLALAILFMDLRRGFMFYNVSAYGSLIDFGAEFITLLISVLMLGGLLGLNFRSNHILNPAPVPGASDRLPQIPMRFLTFTAILLGGIAILGSGVVGFYAYHISRNTILEATFLTNLNLSRTLSKQVDQSGVSPDQAEIITNLETLWGNMETPYQGAYLCVVGPDGQMILHTTSPDKTGTNIGNLEVYSQPESGPRNIQDLIHAKQDWVGETMSRSGQEQLAALVYNKKLDGLIAVRVPMEDVNAEIRSTVLPWAGGFAFITALLIPLSLGLLHWAYSSSQKAMARAQSALKEKEERLQESQKMEAIGRLAGGIAHDFNNLLMVIKGYADLIIERIAENSPMRVDVKEISKAASRAESLTAQLLAFSRQKVLQPSLLNLNSIVGGMEEMLRRLIGEDIELSILLDSHSGTVRVDLNQLEQVIMNLVLNARDAMPQGGRLKIETSSVELNELESRSFPGLHPGQYVLLMMTDTGIGMDLETRSKIFEPFFTTREKGKGTAFKLIQLH